MVHSMFDLNNKVAFVSGASSGIGEHFARVLAEHGAKVVLAARRVDRSQSIVNEIQRYGGEAFAVSMDVTDQSSIKAAFDQAQQRFGIVGIVSNNAGVADSRPVVGTTEDSWDFVLDTNLKGAWLVAREAGLRMIDAKIDGSIVNTASILGLRVAISQASYGTSKAAVIHLTKSLALEWSRKNIRVNALCPGYFKTQINASFLESEKGKAFISNTPAQRVGELDELTAPFLLLASDAGSFVNGVALAVDGAHSLGSI